MTPTTMNTKDFAFLGAPDLVYVREIRAAEVIEDDPQVVLPVEPDAVLYAVHSADGERLAVMTDRETAFATAVAHRLEPVSVH